MSEICESFGCTTAQAIAEDWELVSAVLDYRHAKAAVAVFSGKDRGVAFKTLQDNPSLTEALSAMHQAQTGTDAAGLDVARAHMPEESA